MVFEKKEILLGALASYVRQTTIATKRAVLQAFEENEHITTLFLEYFDAKFNPETKQDFLLIEANLEENKIKNIALSTVFSALKAMVRTNFFKKDRAYLSFKFDSQKIHRLPVPKPMAEVFVSSKEVDAVYLSLGKIARGGIRWSKRKEDLRTEVLLLLKTQRAKNAVIVPIPSKGGFFPKNIPENVSKEEEVKYALKAYEVMIRGLLDLMDNVVEGQIVSPENVVCYDEKDPYLIVAVDKSISAFADLANNVAKEYGFWLGDVFASGGSEGFNRRALGITAQGVWACTKNHFYELELDASLNSFSVVGVGSMAGSVFGNAMLMSDKIKLIAAFSSTSIFFDPTPDEKQSYNERLRLFENHLGWSEYNKELISKGGGVFSRKEKLLTISKQSCQVLGASKTVLSPDELIKLILSAPVDALFFGGVGRYVKASTQTHMEVQDNANSNCRINASDIKAKIVSEGASLGLTQKARVEFALNGGKINTDAIDGSGSALCSDYEINLKILLNSEVEKNVISVSERNEIFSEVQDEINQKILKNIKQQIDALSYMEFRGAKSIPNNKKMIALLKKEVGLDRLKESLPEDKEMDFRFNHAIGLLRPELAVLMAYTKNFLKQEILKTTLVEEEFIKKKMLFSYFPETLTQRFKDSILNHILAKEIVAMSLCNNFVNRMGINFLSKLHITAKASIENAVKVYFIIANAYNTEKLFSLIEKKEKTISEQEVLHKKRELIAEIENLSLALLKKKELLSVFEEIELLKKIKNEKFEEAFYS